MSKTNKEKMVLSKTKRKIFRHTLTLRVLLISVLLLSFLFLAVYLTAKISGLRPVISQYFSYATAFINGPAGLNQEKGITSVIILGVGGGMHEGADLTDTMILFSYNHISRKLSLISLPRDIWIPDLRAKLNTTYHYGEEKKPGTGGFALTKSVVEQITGQPVQYAALVDFNIFKEIIDTLGGINVCVVNSFDDYLFPIPGNETAEPESARYEHIHFDSGCHQMSGDTALKFVRSRYAQGLEGTDYARSARQQLVIKSLKNKLLSPNVLTDIKTIIKLKNSIFKYIITDIPESDLAAFARILFSNRQNPLVQGQLETDDPQSSRSGLLVNPSPSKEIDYQWVLSPKKGFNDWTDIRTYVSSLVGQ